MKLIRPISLVLLCIAFVPSLALGQEVEPGEVVWKYETEFGTMLNPVLDDRGNVYSIFHMEVLSISAISGKPKWKYNVQSNTSDGSLNFEGITLIRNQYLLDNSIGREFLNCIDLSNRKLLWKTLHSGDVHFPAVVSEDTIILSGEYLEAFDLKTGKLLWEIEENVEYSRPFVGIDGDLIACSELDNGGRRLIKIDIVTGEIKKTFNIDIHASPVLGPNDQVIISGGVALKSIDYYDGTLNWNSGELGGGEAGSDFNIPVISDSDKIIVVSDSGRISQISLNGEIEKTFELGSQRHAAKSRHRVVVGNDDKIYLQHANDIICFDLNEFKLDWKFPITKANIDARISSLVLDNGLLIFNSSSSSGIGWGIFALKTSSTSYANSIWPMYGQNNQNTNSILKDSLNITGQSSDKVIELGGGLDIRFDLDGGWPREYKWNHNGKELSSAKTHKIEFESVSEEDAGEYRFFATHNGESVSGKPVKVKVVTKGTPIVKVDGESVINTKKISTDDIITISSSTEGSSIFYSTDGSDPTFESNPYIKPFKLNTTTLLRAISYTSDFSKAFESDAVYLNVVPEFDLALKTRGKGYIYQSNKREQLLQGDVVNLNAEADEGYRFSHWLGGVDSAYPKTSIIMDKDRSIKAVFKPIPQKKLRVISSNGGEVLGNDESSYPEGAQLTIKAVPNEGWFFSNWAGDALGASAEIIITLDRTKEIKANFSTNLETNVSGKGTLSIDPPEGPYSYGTKVKINPVPDAGYYLGVWSGDALGMEKGPIEFEITKANPKISALFVPLKENRFTVTTLASSGGSVVSNPNSNAYINGQEVALTATPDPGYSFVGWTGDIESTANPLITLADANKTVTAEFSRNILAPVTLTIDAVNGQVNRNPADELYEKGTTVELLAQANPGYTFTGWAGALGGTASRTTLFLDGDKVVTANFKASYQLATETRGPGSVLSTPSSTIFIDGDDVILTASPAEGYGFVGWTGDLESTDQQTSLAMDGNKRVIAHFAQLGTLTTWTRGEGTITRSPDKESYFPGASVTLTATPGDGFQFVNWDGQASGTKNPTTVTMDRAMSVAANFKDIKAPTVTIGSPASQETGEETFTLSGTVSDNGKIKSLVWLWKGNEMGELELTEGKFSLEDQKLTGGANDITVVATDRSGNEGRATATPVWTPNRSIRIATATEQQEGNRIEVPIEINSKGDVGGMGFVLNYNHSYLMDPEFTWSSVAGGSINRVNTDVAGELRGTFSLGGTSLPAGEQLVGTVSFRARSVPETLETALGLEDLAISDSTGNKLTSGTDVVSGEARVLVRGITGDNNANDKLDVGDATRIQRLLVGMDRARAWDVTGNDLNGSGDLDPGDVVKVLRTVVGIDPQPNRNRVITKMGGDDDEVETVVLTIKDKTTSTVTIEVQLKDMQSTIAGANFQLEYPTELLRLKDRTSHRAGEMVVKNAAAIWNVSPAQTDYSKQDGTLAMAVSSPEPWTVKDGVLAELTFEVQDGADLNKAVLALSEVEVTPDGFDNRMLDGLELNVGSGATTEPEPSIIEIVAMTKAPFAFSFGAKEGRVYDVQFSEDLRSWGTLKTYNGTGTLIRFEDERDQVFPQIYYRVRVVE